ncbi:MAG: EamA family transporter RarD [Gammaproteobacteria bacterium]|nr:EamA family transporter RarD [Gammaproteobacteria bacterium]
MTAEERSDIVYALIAYSICGLVPIYFMAVRYADASEVLAHRIVWSVLLLDVLLVVMRQLDAFLSLTKHQWVGLVVSSMLLSVNWLTFVWGLFNGYMIETSLGYYINPLVTVLLGVFILAEKPTRLQWLALLIAAAGVVHETLGFDRFPWVALSLAFSFGLYGLVRKMLAIPSLPGLAAETLILLPLAIAWMGYLYGGLDNPLSAYSPGQWALLGVGGLVTVLPLLAFAAAAIRVPLTLLGFIQYLSPTLALILALVVYHEPLREGQLITFACIWTALVLFPLEALYDRRINKRREAMT